MLLYNYNSFKNKNPRNLIVEQTKIFSVTSRLYSSKDPSKYNTYRNTEIN